MTNQIQAKRKHAGLAVGAAIFAAAWLAVRYKTVQAERENPPLGEFLTVDGVRLHYFSKGQGPTVVLLHGNGVIAEDFRNAGLFDQLAQNYRVIAFDRPGFGYSERPRGKLWTPAAQARLIAAALEQLEVRDAVILAHSWGTLVALSMAMQKPEMVTGLVLASGYYYPSVRLDVLTATPAIPLLGDLLAHTLSPLIGRLIWPAAVKRAFLPAAVPDSFKRMAPWMALRPQQLRAEAEETAMMIPSAAVLHKYYPELAMPIAIVVGDGDKIVSPAHNSQHLQRDLQDVDLTVLEGGGHMIQHLSQDALLAAVERVSERASALSSALVAGQGLARPEVIV
jgi:pimeloyl-ACP methyl ester carboxylesterase